MENKLTELTGLNRAFGLIDFLSSYSKGISLAYISQETGLPKSTAHRLLSELIDAGYVIKCESGNYKLSFKVFDLSSRILNNLDLFQVSSLMVKNLSQRAKENVYLSTPHGTNIVYFVYLNKAIPFGNRSATISYVDMHRPMYCTAAGKSMLSQMSPSQVEAIWKLSDIKKNTPNTIVELPVLQKELEECRRNGYAVDNEENEVGIKCVAVCIKDQSGDPLGAISISTSASKMTPERIEELAADIKSCADSISYCMGSKP